MCSGVRSGRGPGRGYEAGPGYLKEEAVLGVIEDVARAVQVQIKGREVIQAQGGHRGCHWGLVSREDVEKEARRGRGWCLWLGHARRARSIRTIMRGRPLGGH